MIRNHVTGSPHPETTGRVAGIGIGINRAGIQSGFNPDAHHYSSQMIPPPTTFFDDTHSNPSGSLSIEQAEALQAKRYQLWLDEYSNTAAQQQQQHHDFTFVSNSNSWQPQQHQRQPQQPQQQLNGFYDNWAYDQYSNSNIVSTIASETSHMTDSPSRIDTGISRPVGGISPSTPRTSASPSNSRPTNQQNSPTTNKGPTKRKRANPKPSAPDKRPRPRQDSDEDSDDEDNDYLFEGGISVGVGGVTGANGNRKSTGRLPGACSHCKKLKMKCDFPLNDNTCKRCKAGGHVCIVEGRKPRTAPNKREYLLAQIRQKDMIIESLLKQLHNPYVATPLSIASYRMATSPSDSSNNNVLAWLDRLRTSVQDAGGKAGPGAFTDVRFSGNDGVVDDEDDEDDEGEEHDRSGGRRLTHAQRIGLVPVHEGNDCEVGEGNGNQGDGGGDDDALQSSLPDSHVPLGLIANLSLSSNKKSKSKKHRMEAKLTDLDEENLDDDNVGVANATYFMPGPATDLDIRATLIEQHSPPEILVHGLVTPDDVDKLFEIFYERINPFISLLDPVLHTPATTFARCPFLFTVVCGISSRYYTEKSEIYPIAMHFAKHSAANALIDGWKTVELCQAYILMSIYAVPAKRWEEDRSWLYTGLAIRIATDLNLHQASATKPQNEKQEREMLNRIRVWMICFNLDRSTATQFGKPSTIKEDYIMRNSQDWYKKHKYNHPYDVHLCGYTALLRIVARFHDDIFSDPNSPSGLNKHVDFRGVTLEHDKKLTTYHKEWEKRFNDALQPDDRGSAFRCLLLPFLVGYSRLVMFSFGFQQGYQRGRIQPGDIFFTKCLEAAKSVIRNMIEKLAPSGYMRFSADGHFTFASFASAFLMKLLRPEFQHLLSKEEENDIFNLIGRLIQTLSSPAIAIDDRHTPKLYARFLAGLLSKHRRDGATVGRLQAQPNPTQQMNNVHQHSFGDVSIPNANAPSMSTFSVAQGPHHSIHGRQQNISPTNYISPDNFVANHAQNSPATPMYHPEVTYAAGAGAIQFGDSNMLGLDGNAVGEEEMLATMQALKNPAWWQNMMMPGFSWSDPSSPGSNVSSSPTPSYNNQTQNPAPAMTNNSGYGIFHSTQQVPLY
ncbi:fungal-specific transcription factor domain-containing protein [Lentinula edodes]|uniref:fungal-specific transcription factor domain-containing protein n=1 Tax=Lentinula edodes TaxID=5353 RepID=UPI001E8DF5EE|nr:fungal-specific transcription factor domain-containing protein [Lentinula edodes]KAH7879353.1 fungal-specific transcription factor domain-containing protein [Lentinula edodes]